MKLLLKITCCLFSVSLLFGCASIVSKSNWPFSVDSNPTGAHVVITNRKGKTVYEGKTPAGMKLKSGSGFFTKESYLVTFTMKGYETKKVTVECKLNGWYFGNILIGGLLGFLIIDPATGAMYKLDGVGITENLSKDTSTTQLDILDINSIPEEWRAHLVKL